RRHPHGTARAACDVGAACQPDELRDRASAVDHPRRRPDPRHGGGRHRRAGHRQGAAGQAGGVLRALQRAGHRAGTEVVPTEYRASFDATVAFLNGGGLSARAFRLDLPGPDASPDDVGALFVQHLGLLMVDTVDIANLEIVEEPHRGSRGVAVTAAGGHRLVELNHVIRDGMTTYPGLPGPVMRPHLTRETSPKG